MAATLVGADMSEPVWCCGAGLDMALADVVLEPRLLSAYSSCLTRLVRALRPNTSLPLLCGATSASTGCPFAMEVGVWGTKDVVFVGAADELCATSAGDRLRSLAALMAALYVDIYVCLNVYWLLF